MTAILNTAKKRVGILVPEGDFIFSSVVGTYKVFLHANNYLVQHLNQDPCFEVELVGKGGAKSMYDGIFTVRPTQLLHEAGKFDLIVIPAIQPSSIEENKDFIPFLQEQYKNGSEIASICIGAFVLASTGLLEGKQCSTHWIAADLFKKMFPNIKMRDEKVITDEAGIYTSGGAYSFLNLLIYLVEKYTSREVALYLAKLMEVDIDRKNQSAFHIFMGQKSHEDEPIIQAQTYIEKNFFEKISVDQLAQMFALSRRNFERRFKKATSNTPNEYLQRVKIEAAKKHLETGKENVNEIMYSVGYNDQKAFRSVFKKYTGISPQQYRKKYNKFVAQSL